MKLHLKLKHLKNAEDKAYSTEDSHCLNDPGSPEQHAQRPTARVV